MYSHLRFVSIPLGEEEQERHEYNRCIESDEIVFYLNEKDYNFLLVETSFFYDVNVATNSLIADNEDDEVIGEENLEKMLEVIDDYSYLKDNSIIPTLKSLTEAALLFETGVYFYL